MLRNLAGPSTSPDNRPRSTTTNHSASGSRRHPQPNASANRGGGKQFDFVGRHPANENAARFDDADGDDAWNDGDSPWRGLGSVDESDGEETKPYAREASTPAKPISPNKFPWKLFRVLDNTAYSDICTWCEDGAGFQILDQDRFVKTAMKDICKSEKGDFGTFAKQLNTYGFKKHGRNRRSLNGRPSVKGPPTWRHVDGLFRRGQPDLVGKIVSKRGDPLVSPTEAIGQDTTMQEPDPEMSKLRYELQASQASNEEKDREIEAKDKEIEELRRANEHKAREIGYLQRFLLSLLPLPLSTSPNMSSADAFLPGGQPSTPQTSHFAPAALRTPQNTNGTVNPTVLSRTIPDELEQHNGVHPPDDVNDWAYLSGASIPPARNHPVDMVRAPTPPSEQWDWRAYFRSHSSPSSEP